MRMTLLALVLGLMACGKKEADAGKPKAAEAVTLAPTPTATPTPVATETAEWDPAWTRAVMEPQIYACMASVDTHIEAMWTEKPKETFSMRYCTCIWLDIRSGWTVAQYDASPMTVYGELAKRGEETRCRDYALSDEDEDL